MLKNLDVEMKRYILLHAKIDNMVELERAIKFYDANMKILSFADTGKDHANPLLFGREEKRKGEGERKRKGQARRQREKKRKGQRKRKGKRARERKRKGKSNNGKGN